MIGRNGCLISYPRPPLLDVPPQPGTTASVTGIVGNVGGPADSSSSGLVGEQTVYTLTPRQRMFRMFLVLPSTKTAT